MPTSKINAMYIVPVANLNYTNLVTACGAAFDKLEPCTGGWCELYVHGALAHINRLSTDLGFGPESVSHAPLY